MDYKCTIEVSPRDPEAVMKALMMDEAYDRSSTSIEREGGQGFY